jgi:protein TonB
MSTSSSTTSATGEAFGHEPQKYSLSSDLARLSLPAEYRDQYRTLAWVNSICALFLIIGIVGLKAPKVHVRQIAPVVENLPVAFTPPEEQPKPETQPEPDETPQDAPTEAPQVVTIVAALNSPDVAFAVPVQGAVAVAEAKYASAPPVHLAGPPRPQKFDPNATTDGGSYPAPPYPGIAQRNGYQGVILLEIAVDVSGAVASVKVNKSSGFPILDEAAIKTVKERWRFPPGSARLYVWECTYQMPGK